jgi:uncharacterized protein YoxC
VITAEVAAGDVAAVAAVVVLLVAVVALLVVVRALMRSLRLLDVTVAELRRGTVPLVDDAQRALQRVNAELERVDALLDTAQSVGATVDSASRLAYLAFSNPLIKTMAFASGTGRAFRRLRRRRRDAGR